MTHEAKRLTELRKYNILDSLTEKDYEDVTFMASVICDVPIALISFVDDDRQWFKSHHGLNTSETLREYSFCSHALVDPDKMLIVEDSRMDERFQHNPLVTGDPGIVFYAGVPLINKEGFGLGTVCIIDTKTRSLTDTQVSALKILSNQVMHLLELRKINYELELMKLQLETRNKDLEQFAMVLSHDIKSPLTSVLLTNSLIKKQFGKTLGEEFTNMVDMSNNSANKIKTLVDGILSYYQDNKNVSSPQNIDMDEFFGSLNNTIASPKKYNITYTNDIKTVYYSRVQLEQVFYNLINNSIRYNDKDIVEINIALTEDNNFYIFSFKDNGIGIAKDNYDKIFELFTTLSLLDELGLKGSGIGLSTIKKLIENGDGKIAVSSVLGEGTTFNFTLKKLGSS
ncbi:MAG: GAF domain-containing sensor histidine kinase [Ferruginibacter sp.]